MLTLDIKPNGTTLAFKVLDGAPLFTAIPDKTGALLLVFPDESERLVPAEDKDWFLNLCKNCETWAELCDYMGWEIDRVDSISKI